jgi:cytochrome P450
MTLDQGDQMAAPHVESLKSTADREPFRYYDQLRRKGEVVWDDGLQSWIATSYNSCKKLMRNDDTIFRHPDIDSELMLEIAGGGRHVKLLKGQAHQRLHDWMLRVMSPKLVAEWRPTKIRPIVQVLIDRIATQGRAELVRELAAEAPIRVIAALCDLPWSDEWIERVRTEMAAMSELFDRTLQATDEINKQALTASSVLNQLFHPFIEARRSAKGTDLISLLWTDGPTLLADWNYDDVLANARQLFFNTSSTTSFAIANALYLLLTQAGVADALRTDGQRALDTFVEEALRLHGSAHFRPRLANMDTELCGVRIREGQTVTSLQASANRDPARYKFPDSVDLHRKAPRDHLAFSYGPRACVGAGLARGILQEVVQGVLTQLPDIRLEPNAQPPSYRGFMTRSYRPLHVLFTPDPAGPTTP